MPAYSPWEETWDYNAYTKNKLSLTNATTFIIPINLYDHHYPSKPYSKCAVGNKTIKTHNRIYSSLYVTDTALTMRQVVLFDIYFI
jgi:hypothetical protein